MKIVNILLLIAAGYVIPAQAMLVQPLRRSVTAFNKNALAQYCTSSIDSSSLHKTQIAPELSGPLVQRRSAALLNTLNITQSDSTKQLPEQNLFHHYKRYQYDRSEKPWWQQYTYSTMKTIAAGIVSACTYFIPRTETCYAYEANVSEPSYPSPRICDGEAEEHLSTPIEQYNYTINLMWVNRTFEPGQKYIHPSKDVEELKTNILNKVYQWAALNPSAMINIWYDSEFLSTPAIEDTQTIVNAYLSAHPESAQILLKDVRELPTVKNNPNIFSDAVPIFFRVDLLRLIATVHTLTQSEQLTYFVYTDLDASPIAHDELLDSTTLKKLEEYGIVVTDQGHCYYENNFHIMSNQKPNLITAVKHALIKLNIYRCKHALENSSDFGSTRFFSQLVYKSYPLMFRYFLHLEHKLIWLDDNEKPYDYKTDKFKQFLDNKNIYGDTEFKTIIKDQEILQKCNSCAKREYWLGPTKKIIIPPAESDYTYIFPKKI